MGNRYWKVVCRYGHVGRKKEVSVARYINMKENEGIVEVMNLVSGMPGIKNNGIVSIKPIDKDTYILGKEEEKQNFYLQKLMTYTPKLQLYQRKGVDLSCA